MANVKPTGKPKGKKRGPKPKKTAYYVNPADFKQELVNFYSYQKELIPVRYFPNIKPWIS